jgi:predicted GNAT family acetyltransferase
MAAQSITHRPQTDGRRGTFDLDREGARVGYLSYRLDGTDTMVVDYVEVNPSLQGRGLGQVLVDAAVEWARANTRRIVPTCGYARTVLHRGAKYQDVLHK